MGFAARTVLLFALLGATLGASPSGNGVVRLLEQMRGASGPVWQAHIVSVARLNFNGAAAVVSTESEGLRVSVRHCIGEVCDGTYFDGQRIYSFNINGTMVPDSQELEPFLRSLRIVASLDFLTPSFIARGGRVGAAGTASVNSKTYRTFVIGDSNSVPLRLFVDPQSGLVRYARSLDGRDTFEYRGYRRVGALALAFEVLHNGRVFERYDDRAAVSSAFHPPRGLVPKTPRRCRRSSTAA